MEELFGTFPPIRVIFWLLWMGLEQVSDVCHVPCQDRAANQASDRRSSGEPSTSGNHADEDTKRPNLMRANLKRRVPTQRSSVQAATHKSSVHPTSRGLRSPARLRRGKSVQGRLKAQNARFSPGVRAQVAEVPYELKGTSAAKDAIYMKGLIERLSREQSASLESGLKRCEAFGELHGFLRSARLVCCPFSRALFMRCWGYVIFILRW